MQISWHKCFRIFEDDWLLGSHSVRLMSQRSRRSSSSGIAEKRKQLYTLMHFFAFANKICEKERVFPWWSSYKVQQPLSHMVRLLHCRRWGWSYSSNLQPRRLCVSDEILIQMRGGSFTDFTFKTSHLKAIWIYLQVVQPNSRIKRQNRAYWQN